MSLTHALKWSFLSELASKLIQPVVFVVLVRLLTPEDFGVMSAALMVMAFSQIFWEAGMGKALIQRQADVQDAANVAFWVNFGLAVLIAGLLYIAASPIALIFFQDPRVTSVIKIMILQVFLGALGSVHTALLQKEMGFKKLFWVRFATLSLPGLASIPLAWQGLGYWALVAGTLVGQAAQVVMLWRMSSWRPCWSFHVPVAKEMGRFGSWVGLSGLLAWFYGWMDALIVGMYLGSHDLGMYRSGNQFSTMVFALLFGPITPVLYSQFARMNSDQRRIKLATERVIKASIIAAIPVAIIIYSISGSIGETLFGDKWEGVGFVIGVMALTHGFSWIVGVRGWVCHAIGKPSYEAMFQVALLAIYVILYIYGVSFGLEFFIWVRFGCALLSVVLSLMFLKVIIEIKILATINCILVLTIGSVFICFSIAHLLQFCKFNAWIELMLSGLLSALVIGIGVCFVEKDRIVRDLMLMFERHQFKN